MLRHWRSVHGERRAAGERVKVSIVVEELQAMFNRHGSNEAIDGLSNRETGPVTSAIELRGVDVGFQAPRSKHREIQ